jgi:hypothetical protein
MHNKIQVNRFKIIWVRHPDYPDSNGDERIESGFVDAKTSEKALEKWHNYLKANRAENSFERQSIYKAIRL